MKYNLKVNYKDVAYYPQGGFFNQHLMTVRCLNIHDIEGTKYELENIAKFEECDDEVILHLGKLYFDISNETPEFKEEWLGKVSFNLKTMEGVADLDFCNKFISNNFNIMCCLEISQYIQKVIDINQNVSDYCKGKNELTKSFKISSPLTLINFTRLISTNLIEVEKLITSGNEKMLSLIISRKDGKLEKGKKINQVIDLPKFAIDYIKNNELEKAEKTIRLICDEFDGNTLKIIFDMFDAFIPYNRSKKVNRWSESPQSKQKEFIEIVYDLMKKDYKITNLLNYLLKQNMYWNKTQKGFNLPFEEAKLLRDYLSICEQYSLVSEKYPQDLSKTHDVVVKNIKVLKYDETKVNEFKSAINNYYKKDIEVDDFIFTAPEDILSLVKEGNDLHHCIGNYVDNVIKGISGIFYMRLKNNPQQSYVTIELNPKTYELVEFKGNFNKEPTEPEVIKAVKEFVTKKKKELKGGK